MQLRRKKKTPSASDAGSSSGSSSNNSVTSKLSLSGRILCHIIKTDRLQIPTWARIIVQVTIYRIGLVVRSLRYTSKTCRAIYGSWVLKDHNGHFDTIRVTAVMVRDSREKSGNCIFREKTSREFFHFSEKSRKSHGKLKIISDLMY